DSMGCPHCDNRDVVRWGQASALPRYRCKACSRTFNALTKTPLANFRMKDKRWDMPRKSRKRGGKSAKRGLSAEQIPVIVARDRQGATTDAVLPKLNRVSIAAALGGVVTSANEFCCDGGTAIVAFARRAGIPAHVLPMPGKPN